MQALHDAHASALWAYAVRLTGDHAHAQDVVQETLLRAWRHPEVLERPEGSVRAWLFTVARNLVVDERVGVLRGEHAEDPGHARELADGLAARGARGQVLLERAPVARAQRAEHVGGVEVGELAAHATTPISSSARRSARSA
jgi:DNA-directed RNA polymerase specialized sigma24 family protein